MKKASHGMSQDATPLYHADTSLGRRQIIAGFW